MTTQLRPGDPVIAGVYERVRAPTGAGSGGRGSTCRHRRWCSTCPPPGATSSRWRPASRSCRPNPAAREGPQVARARTAPGPGRSDRALGRHGVGGDRVRSQRDRPHVRGEHRGRAPSCERSRSSRARRTSWSRSTTPPTPRRCPPRRSRRAAPSASSSRSTPGWTAAASTRRRGVGARPSGLRAARHPVPRYHGRRGPLLADTQHELRHERQQAAMSCSRASRTASSARACRARSAPRAARRPGNGRPRTRHHRDPGGHLRRDGHVPHGDGPRVRALADRPGDGHQLAPNRVIVDAGNKSMGAGALARSSATTTHRSASTRSTGSSRPRGRRRCAPATSSRSCRYGPAPSTGTTHSTSSRTASSSTSGP